MRRAFFPLFAAKPPPLASSAVAGRTIAAAVPGRPASPWAPVPEPGVAASWVASLVDLVPLPDEAEALLPWLRALCTQRGRLDITLGSRLVRAYRLVGHFDRAREIAALFPPAVSGFQTVDALRLVTERAMLALLEGRDSLGEAEARNALRLVPHLPKGIGVRETLDAHVANAEVEIRTRQPERARELLRHAEHLWERVEGGAARTATAYALATTAVRLEEPETALRHFYTVLDGASPLGAAAMQAHGNLALVLGATGRHEEARGHATQAILLARTYAPGLAVADALDILAFVELLAEEPAAAVAAVDEAWALLSNQPDGAAKATAARRRAWALAMVDRPELAVEWLETARMAGPSPDDAEETTLVTARVLEAQDRHAEVIAWGAPRLETMRAAFWRGCLAVVVARAHLALGQTNEARTLAERAALLGAQHGWIYPQRARSRALWETILTSGDSRAVRHAEKMVAYAEVRQQSLPGATDLTQTNENRAARGHLGGHRGTMPSFHSMVDPMELDPSRLDAGAGEGADEMLVYVTTPQGVARVPRPQLEASLEGASLVVDTLAHVLRVDGKESSLERRRALEPLLVQLLRRARTGLTAEEILKAAGGPGPESADAEHRVRVLISRIRDLLGDPRTIERTRDAGEHGKTRYRLAENLRFALVEPLVLKAK
jgi:tetratricopeptide (TPR) repeat protein